MENCLCLCISIWITFQKVKEDSFFFQCRYKDLSKDMRKEVKEELAKRTAPEHLETIDPNDESFLARGKLPQVKYHSYCNLHIIFARALLFNLML